MKNGKKEMANKGKKNQQKVTKLDVGIYTGPIVLTSSKTNSHVIKGNLGNSLVVTSSAGGVVANVYSSDPTTSSNWGANSSNFDEYRTLGIRVSFYPYDRYAPGILTATRPLAIVADHNGSNPVTSWADVTSYESGYLIKNIGDPWVKELRMHDIGEGVWINTASAPTNAFYIKLWADTLTASTSYGRVIITWLVEFRGRGI